MEILVETRTVLFEKQYHISSYTFCYEDITKNIIPSVEANRELYKSQKPESGLYVSRKTMNEFKNLSPFEGNKQFEIYFVTLK